MNTLYIVSREGNLKAQALNDKYFEKRGHFRWRGIGDIPNSALKLKDEYAHLDAEVVFKTLLLPLNLTTISRVFVGRKSTHFKRVTYRTAYSCCYSFLL